MPRFLKQNDPSLSTLNKVKRVVNKKLKQQYRIAPDDIVAPAGADGEAPVGAPAPSSNKARGMAPLLSDLETLVSEVIQSTRFYVDGGVQGARQGEIANIPKQTDVVKDLASKSSEIVNLCKRGQAIVASANYDFNGKVTEPELTSMVSDALNIASMISGRRGLARYINRLQRLLDDEGIDLDIGMRIGNLRDALQVSFERWGTPTSELVSKLVPILREAKKSPAMRGGRMLGADGHGIRPMVENVFGGALVRAYQSPPSGDNELLSCGYVSRQPLVPLVQSYAPRNTMDLRGLPRYLM